MIKLITNTAVGERWEMVPRKLVGAWHYRRQSRYPWQPSEREPPLRAATNGHRHTDSVSGNLFTWSPTYLNQNLPRAQPISATICNWLFSIVPQRFMIQHERESAMIRQSTMANEPQRSAGMKCGCNLSQGKPCQIPWATPLVLYSIVLSLTLPKLHLASFKLNTNRWALGNGAQKVGGGLTLPKAKHGGIHGNPASGNHL